MSSLIAMMLLIALAVVTSVAFYAYSSGLLGSLQRPAQHGSEILVIEDIVFNANGSANITVRNVGSLDSKVGSIYVDTNPTTPAYSNPQGALISVGQAQTFTLPNVSPTQHWFRVATLNGSVFSTYGPQNIFIVGTMTGTVTTTITSGSTTTTKTIITTSTYTTTVSTQTTLYSTQVQTTSTSTSMVTLSTTSTSFSTSTTPVATYYTTTSTRYYTTVSRGTTRTTSTRYYTSPTSTSISTSITTTQSAYATTTSAVTTSYFTTATGTTPTTTITSPVTTVVITTITTTTTSGFGLLSLLLILVMFLPFLRSKKNWYRPRKQ